jgi:hypothetical protein
MAKTIPFKEGDPDRDLADEVLDKVRAILGEHFEVGIVLLTKVSDDGRTSYHSTEFGNKFAIRGLVDSYQNGELNGDDDDEDAGELC